LLSIYLFLSALLPFTSARRRMSIIIGMPDGSIRLYCKGADSALIPLCIRKIPTSHVDGVDSCVHDSIVKNLEVLSGDGLRTLVMCTKYFYFIFIYFYCF
jgi:magnesium-transporting ATPase (P-type)